jgi:hypothetical protein
MKLNFLYNLIWVYIFLNFAACKKSDFLNAKPDDSSVVPSTLTDFQAILDNDLYMNGGINTGIIPSIGEIGADNYFLPDATYNSASSTLQPREKAEYIWKASPYPGTTITDWNYPYRAIFYCNEVLDGISSLTTPIEQLQTYNNVKGSALFYRAHMFYQLLQVFAPPYKNNSANGDFGIPLRLTPDINEHISRATLQESYDRVITDLKRSISLLPITPLYKTRPSRPAAYGLLARVYQTMQDYEHALLYADSCLQLKNELLDYNSLSVSNSFPFQAIGIAGNIELLFQSTLILSVALTSSSTDSILFNSYATNDLRRGVFFSTSSTRRFKGNYTGTNLNNAFGGIATDEMYLVRAECRARAGAKDAAMADLNTLMKKRWKNGLWTDTIAVDATDALNKILVERRKELLMRGLRWTDLRRLNMDPQYAKNLSRIISGQIYTLSANDLRYVYLIPDDVLSFNPGMPQNLR